MHIELQTLKLTISLLFMGYDGADFTRVLIVRGQITALRLLLKPGAPAAFVALLDEAYNRADARLDELCGEGDLAAAVKGS